MIDEDLKNISMTPETTNPKELFDVNDIEGKTELTAEQVIIIAKLKVLGYRLQEKNIQVVSKFINDFLTLQLSKDRKSRGEFVSAFQSRNDERMGGVLDKFSLNLGK